MTDLETETMQTKGFDWEVKSLDDAGRFSIYFAAFGNVDRADEVIEPGAFRNLDDFVKAGWIGTNHQMNDLPVGFPVTATQDAKGLLVTGQFHSTPAAQECRTVITERYQAGKSVKGSVGYRVLDSQQGKLAGKSIKILKNIDLFEASFVNLPANTQADLVSVKSADEPSTPEGDPMPDLYSLVEVKTLLDGLKAGRVISKVNHEKLTDYAETLDTHGKSACAMAQDMKSWLGQVKPPGADEPDDDKPKDKDVVPQDRAAGNSIPADQNPHGEVTADDLARRKAAKAEQLSALRNRVLKDLTRFASLSS